MEKMDFSAVLTNFGVPIKVCLFDSTDGEWKHGEWNRKEISKLVEVVEPFLPSNLATQVPITLNYSPSGRYEDYDMMWYSALSVPTKTIVEHQGLQYSVESITPYTDYSNVTVYRLKAVETIEYIRLPESSG